MVISLGNGTCEEFFAQELKKLDLKDKRLNVRAKKIMIRLQTKLGSCIRRVFIEREEARQAYDFF